MPLDDIRKFRILPAVTLDRSTDAVPVAKALGKAGLPLLEITFRTDAAEESIRCITAEFSDFTVGAGTIIDPDQIAKAQDAGARFGVAPGCSEPVLAEAQQREFPMIPGVATASEVEMAMRLGYKLLKFFPAEALGGIEVLEALTGPFLHTGVRFIVTGGINAQNMGRYLALPIVGAVCGSWFVNRNLIASAHWHEITEFTNGARGIAAHAGQRE